MTMISNRAFGLGLRAIGRPILGSPLPAAVQRQATALLLGLMPSAPGVARVRREIAGVPVLELTPANARAGATVLYFHGGGYVIGSPSGHRALLSHLAVAARTRVVAVDYRLAPEHPFPAAVTDAVAVNEALLADGQDPAGLVVAGDSAGGGLAVSVAIDARDSGSALPGRLVLISPWLDLRDSASGDDRLDHLLRRRGLDRWAATYCGGGGGRGRGEAGGEGGGGRGRGDMARSDPRASPLLASPAGLPPILVQYDVGEILAGQSVEFIASARAAGVSVEVQPFSGLWHDFQLFTVLPVARGALAMAGEFVAAEV